MIKVGIIGGTGYVGIELLRLLLQHPLVQVAHVTTESYSGESIASVYPHLQGLTDVRGEALNLKIIKQSCDVVFIALPHGHAIEIVPELLAAKIKVIDLGADFRLKDASAYQQWYQHPPAPEVILKQAIYGLPENGYKEIIARAALIANPGCYPTASLLASIPAIKANIIDLNDVIFDAKSGVSGAGRVLSLTSHFCEVSGNIIPYQLAGLHRHIPEIEQELGIVARTPMAIQFTPHLVPMIRGLMVTAYFKLKQPFTVKEVHAIYQHHYQHEPFIRIAPLLSVPQIKHVTGTNYCDIGLYVDQRTQRLIVVSVIDNLIKGAAGQAIHNMNLMYQLPEGSGLKQCFATYP